MTIEPPQPPTAPAPATRPTPPTPPRIDMSPFRKSSDDNSADEAADTSPEAQARDAVANGSGPLTKRTVERDDDNQAQSPAPTPRREVSSDAPLNDTQSDYDRGQDVLRQFREMDARDSQSAQFPPAQTSTERPQPVAPTINHQQGYGVVYWIFTIIFVAVAAVIVAKKFLFTGKPSLTKSQLSMNESTSTAPAKSATPPKPATPSKPARATKVIDKPKATVDKPKPVKPPPKPSTPSKDDDKGKHFEIRV